MTELHAPILITGSTGIAGMHIATALRRSGDRVLLARRSAGPETIALDVTDPSAIERIPEIVGIIHCAGLVPRSGAQQWSEFERVNVFGTESVARWALARKARFFVYVTTGGRLGRRHATRSTRLYVVSKYLGERRARRLLRGVVPGVSLRASSLYGEFDRGSTARLIRAVARGRFVVPTGAPVRKCLLYAGSLGDVVAALVRQDLADWRRAAIADVATYELAEIVAAIERVLRRRVPRVPFHPRAIEVMARGIERVGELSGRRGLADYARAGVIAVTPVACPAENLLREYVEAQVPLDVGIAREVEWMRATGAL